MGNLDEDNDLMGLMPLIMNGEFKCYPSIDWWFDVDKRECFKEVLPANKNNEFRYKTSCIENV